MIARRRILNRICLNIPISLILVSCAQSPSFQAGATPTSRFVSDRAECRRIAAGEHPSLEDQAERYDTGSASQVVGAGLATMLVDARAEAKAFKKCMNSKGYHHRP